MSKRNGKRSLLYRIFFKTAGVGREPAPGYTQPASAAQPAPAAQPRPPMRWITFAVRNEDEEVVREMNAFPFVIGREHFAGGLQIENKSVSRRHALVDLKDGEITISDQNSSNGVEISGKRLLPGEATVLRAGDLIKIGRVEMAVMDISDSPGRTAGGEFTEYSGRTEFLMPKPPPAPPNVPVNAPVNRPGQKAARPVYCTNCGSPNTAAESMFCTKCGGKLVK